MLSNRSVISVSSDAGSMTDIGIQRPDALTPEVMVFFGLLAFLAVIGPLKGGCK